MIKKAMLIFAAMIFMNINLLAGEHENSEEAEHNEEHHGNHHLAAFLGLTSNFEEEETNFSAGLDYEFRLPFADRLFGIGLFGEYVFAEESEILAGIPINIHPWKELLVFAAPGLAFVPKATEESVVDEGKNIHNNTLGEEAAADTEKESKFLARVGIGYEFETRSFSIAPVVAADFVDGNVSLVYGLSFGIGF